MVVRRGALLTFPAENILMDYMQEVRVQDGGGLLQGRQGHRHLQVRATVTYMHMDHDRIVRLTNAAARWGVRAGLFTVVGDYVEIAGCDSVWVRACLSICVRVCNCIYTHIHTYTHMSTYIHTLHTHIHTYTHMSTYIHAHTHIHTSTHTHTHTHKTKYVFM